MIYISKQKGETKMKLTEDEVLFFDIMMAFGYDVSVNSKQVTIKKEDFRVDLDKRGLEEFMPIIMEPIETGHF